MYNKPDFLDEDSTFVRRIEMNNNICNSCYRRVREDFETVHDIAGSILEYEEHADFAYFDDFRESGRPSTQESYCSCGSVDWQDARIRPIKDKELFDISERLSERLDEQDVEHDKNILVSYIKNNYREPEYQDREELLFEDAVENAVL